MMKEAQERDGSPIIYLHDPETGKPFAVLLSLEAYDEYLPDFDDIEIHSHLEGDELDMGPTETD